MLGWGKVDETHSAVRLQETQVKMTKSIPIKPKNKIVNTQNTKLTSKLLNPRFVSGAMPTAKVLQTQPFTAQCSVLGGRTRAPMRWAEIMTSGWRI